MNRRIQVSLPDTVIRQWDGKDTDVLTDYYRQYSGLPAFASQLIAMLTETDLQPAASWLLKHGLEHTPPLQLIAQQEVSLLCSVPQLVCWQSRLHLLQILQYVLVPDDAVGPLVHFLRAGLQDSNKFVRAWSYSGFYLLGQQYPEYQDEARAYIVTAMQDEAPSVKARLRQLGVSDVPDG